MPLPAILEHNFFLKRGPYSDAAIKRDQREAKMLHALHDQKEEKGPGVAEGSPLTAAVPGPAIEGEGA